MALRGTIKICGITRMEDALLSVEHGANTLGFNFYPRSPRYIKPERAAGIINRLTSRVVTVGIFVREVDPDLAELVQVLQIHGLMDRDQIPSLGRRILVATSVEESSRFPNHEIIIDTSWGSGRVADWEKLKQLERPYILSGGLNPENVARALQVLRPVGVDVCSGVEAEPGIKDEAKVKAFLEAATAYFSASPSTRNRKLEQGDAGQ